jgi:oligoribonuclease
MTGLDLERDVLIEVAALVTDSELNVLGPGVDVVIHADDAALAGMVEVVREMHDKSGLTEAVRRSTITVAQAEQMIMDYVTQYVPEPRSAPLCGNSIATDRGYQRRHSSLIDETSIIR